MKRRTFSRAALYLSFVKIAIRAELAYRSAYFAGIVAQWLSYGATFASLYIIVSSFENLAGWKSEEVLFLYAINILSYALAACLFFNPCQGLAEKVRNGEFDSALTKPVSPFAHELYMGFNFAYVSHVSLSIAVMIFAVIRVGIAITPLSVLIFILMIIGATLIQAAILIAVSALSFFFVNENPVFGLVWTFKNFIHYPLSIFPLIIQALFTFVLPLAFINFYPSAAILGKGDSIPFTPLLAYLSPLAGVVFFVLSIVFWNWALSKYQSTGS
jgi:ABC-2 type transport system permease protein